MDSYKKINLHTHSTFCDGKNSPEEMILAAIAKGFDVLGFSGHSIYPFARSWHISPRDFDAYEKNIAELKNKYSDKIKILCGYEADYFPGVSVPSKKDYKEQGLHPDYLIGSVHYVVTDKGHYSVDNSADKVKYNLIRLYGNGSDFSSVDFKKAICEYFEAEQQMLRIGNFDILGHGDLIRKRNSVLNFLDESESWYKEQLKLTAKEIKKADVIVEINTGAIARGAMDDCYPSEYFLKLLYDLNVPICINSDAHNTKDLDCAFERAAQEAKKIGYKELTYPIDSNLVHIKL